MVGDGIQGACGTSWKELHGTQGARGTSWKELKNRGQEGSNGRRRSRNTGGLRDLMEGAAWNTGGAGIHEVR
jgi:hypothetical protein